MAMQLKFTIQGYFSLDILLSYTTRATSSCFMVNPATLSTNVTPSLMIANAATSSLMMRSATSSLTALPYYNILYTKHCSVYLLFQALFHHHLQRALLHHLSVLLFFIMSTTTASLMMGVAPL